MAPRWAWCTYDGSAAKKPSPYLVRVRKTAARAAWAVGSAEGVRHATTAWACTTVATAATTILLRIGGAEVLEECERYKEPTALGIALRRASPCAQSDVGTGGMHIHGSLAYDIPNPSNLCDDIDNPNIYLTLNPAFSGGRFQYAGVGGVGERHHRPQLSITPPHERFTTLPAVYAAAAESDEDNP